MPRASVALLLAYSATNRLLKSMRIEISLTDSAIRLVAEYASSSATLARGIKSIMSRIVEDLVFNEAKGKVRFGLKEVRAAVEAAG